MIGQIERHYILNNNQKATKYDHLIPLLVSLEESEEISGLIDSVGCLSDALEALRAMTKAEKQN